ncbi:MAG: hypothetical protein ABIJ96_18825 [Elusimicrobiota bacterium]
MKTHHRVLLAFCIVLVDTAVFFVPLTSLLAAYVIIAQPAWFLRWVASNYRPAEEAPDAGAEEEDDG